MKSHYEEFYLCAEVGPVQNEGHSARFVDENDFSTRSYLVGHAFGLRVGLLHKTNYLLSCYMNVPCTTERNLYEHINRYGFFLGDPPYGIQVFWQDMFQLLRGHKLLRMLKVRGQNRTVFR